MIAVHVPDLKAARTSCRIWVCFIGSSRSGTKKSIPVVVIELLYWADWRSGTLFDVLVASLEGIFGCVA